MNVTYEVTAVVPHELADQFEEYMTSRHLADVLATGHFEAATFSRTGGKYRVTYVAHSRQSLDQYLARDTDRLRADFQAHFPTGVDLSREIWDVVKTFGPTD